MKRKLILFLIPALLCCFLGCSSEATGTTANTNTVEFYYQRTSYIYGASDGVIASETREIANRISTLPYLLSLYLRGPLDEDLTAPFPAGTKLLNVTQDGSTLCVTLDSTFSNLKNMNLTVACACIAKTCFSLADVTQVQIRSIAPENADSVNVVISIDSMLLYDNSALTQQSATEESQ